MKRKFIGVQYMGPNVWCTSGNPNKKTGRHSLAIEAHCFDTMLERSAWVSRHHLRKTSTKAQLRTMKLGVSLKEFEEYYQYILTKDDMFKMESST